MCGDRLNWQPFLPAAPIIHQNYSNGYYYTLFSLINSEIITIKNKDQIEVLNNKFVAELGLMES